jgi:hypothetical protein
MASLTRNCASCGRSMRGKTRRTALPARHPPAGTAEIVGRMEPEIGAGCVGRVLLYDDAYLSSHFAYARPSSWGTVPIF